MKHFKKKEIQSEIVGIIDVWTYKIRVAICQFNKEDIKILWFSEKRQSSLDIVNNDIKNLEWICENINLAFKKAIEQSLITPEKMVINPIFWKSFFSAKKLSHTRKDKYRLINQNELKFITKNLEKISYITATKTIFDNYLYPESDLEVIISNVSEIKIDKVSVSDPIQKNGEKISFGLLNIFLSKNNIELLNYIAKYLKKDLEKILPEEFCTSKIWRDNEELVIINIWNTSSSITVKDSGNNIEWSLNISVWIDSLIKKIKKEKNFSQADIIKKIDRNDFALEEKDEFLEIYCFLIANWLKEILQDRNCPSNFFVVGWWAENSFLKTYIRNFDFSKHIKIDSKIKLVTADVWKIKKIVNVENILNNSNLNIISMIIAYNDLRNKKNDQVEICLKEALEEIVKEV